MASSDASSRDKGEGSIQISLKTVRDSLIRQEDSIVFSLIERARHPYNAAAYDKSSLKLSGSSLAEIFVREAEHLHAKAGRYDNPEEVPFFSEDLPLPLLPPYNYPQVLHPVAASVNITKTIWNMYFNELLPLLTSKGDDGNYASTLALDLACLQALSRRIHYGKYVAEVKFKDAPKDYSSAIHDKVKMLRERNKVYGTIRFVDISSKNYLPEENQGLDYKTVMGKIHAIESDGTIYTNVEAFRRLYEEVGLGWIYAITKYEPISTIANLIYRIWATYRLQLTGRPSLEKILESKNNLTDGTCNDDKVCKM